jgi:hypothetical protein
MNGSSDSMTPSRGWLLRGMRQDPHDLLVGDLPDVLVPEVDRKQQLGLMQANHLVDLATQDCDDV